MKWIYFFPLYFSILLLNPTVGYIWHGIRAYDRRRNYRGKALIVRRLTKKLSFRAAYLRKRGRSLFRNCLPAETKLSPLRTAYLRKGGRQPFPSCLPAETRSFFFLIGINYFRAAYLRKRDFYLLTELWSYLRKRDRDFRATRSETGFFIFISALLTCRNVLLDRKRNLIFFCISALLTCGNVIIFICIPAEIRGPRQSTPLRGRRLTRPVKPPCIPEILYSIGAIDTRT